MGEYYYKIESYSDAIYQFNRAKDSIDKSDKNTLLDFLAFLSIRFEVINPNQSVKYLEEIIEQFEKDPDVLSNAKKADTYNQIASVSLRYKINSIEKDIHFLEEAYKIYDSLPGQAGNAANIAMALSESYEKTGQKKLSKKFKDIGKSYTLEFGTKVDKYKTELYSAFKSKDLQKMKLLENEACKNEELFFYWNITYMGNLLLNDMFDECIEVGLHFLKEENKNVKRSDIALIYRIISDSYNSKGKAIESVSFLKKAADILVGDQKLHWQLCHNSFAIKDFETAKNEAEKLINCNPKLPGPYIVLSHIDFVEGKTVNAIKRLKEAHLELPKSNQIKENIKELEDINDGLISVEDSKYFKRYKSNDSLLEEESTKVKEKSEFEEFTDDVVSRLSKFIVSLRKTPPEYINLIKEGKYSAKETFFRDGFQRILSQLYEGANAEIKVKNGQADLSVQKFNSEIIIEFKIWGRNDYKDSVNQLFGYLTGENIFGIIFMINMTKSDIVEKYREEVIFNSNPDYVAGSYRKNNNNKNNIKCLSSVHKNAYGNRVKVIHFIYDFY